MRRTCLTFIRFVSGRCMQVERHTAGASRLAQMRCGEPWKSLSIQSHDRDHNVVLWPAQLHMHGLHGHTWTWESHARTPGCARHAGTMHPPPSAYRPRQTGTKPGREGQPDTCCVLSHMGVPCTCEHKRATTNEPSHPAASQAWNTRLAPSSIGTA